MIWEVLKWAALVLAAGFVGYFGRHLAMTLIRRLGGARHENHKTVSQDENGKTAAAKLEKKRLKHKLKAEKKRLRNGLDEEER